MYVRTRDRHRAFTAFPRVTKFLALCALTRIFARFSLQRAHSANLCAKVYTGRIAGFKGPTTDSQYYIILEHVTAFSKALTLWFVSHYIFNLEYCKQAKDVSLFMQEFVWPTYPVTTGIQSYVENDDYMEPCFGFNPCPHFFCCLSNWQVFLYPFFMSLSVYLPMIDRSGTLQLPLGSFRLTLGFHPLCSFLCCLQVTVSPLIFLYLLIFGRVFLLLANIFTLQNYILHTQHNLTVSITTTLLR